MAETQGAGRHDDRCEPAGKQRRLADLAARGAVLDDNLYAAPGRFGGGAATTCWSARRPTSPVRWRSPGTSASRTPSCRTHRTCLKSSGRAGSCFRCCGREAGTVAPGVRGCTEDPRRDRPAQTPDTTVRFGARDLGPATPGLGRLRLYSGSGWEREGPLSSGIHRKADLSGSRCVPDVGGVRGFPTHLCHADTGDLDLAK